MAIREVGDRVYALHYDFYDQQIGVVIDLDDVMVIDTRSTPEQAREILADLRSLTAKPVSIVVDTHWHYDHAFGNSVFRPAAIWGHVRAAERIVRDGPEAIREIAAVEGQLAADIVNVRLDPPEHTFDDRATVMVGDRRVELAYHGRAHTEGDISVTVPDAQVLFGGDLIEQGAPPSFGDSFPMDWPATVERLLPLATGAVVPGHGKVGGRTFVEEQLSAFQGLAALALEVHDGGRSIEDAIAKSPFGPKTPRDAFERAIAQLRGELD
ncbi:MAG TPA: MBL fold metallo-hydrolase [Candidatus Limnocylindrales bacterium]|nr:MBL fold metallo-hydrolase [Candidatus Limnocylindrales bacterium]